MNRLIVTFLFLLLPGLLRAEANPVNMLQMLDYMAVDYGSAVKDGEVKNREEYLEMRDFASGIAADAAAMPDGQAKQRLQTQAKQLLALVDKRADGVDVAELTAEMRELVLTEFKVLPTPRRPPDFALGEKLYASNCAVCHGISGDGQGKKAAELNPPPIAFIDSERAAKRSIYGLYNTITLGVEGTAMTAFSKFSDDARWSLAFYVGSLGVPADVAPNGGKSELTLAQITTMSPDEVEAKFGATGRDQLVWLRNHPEGFWFDNPIELASAKLDESLTAYRKGMREEAYQLAVSAYLEGFELAETALRNVDEELLMRIERAMTSFRKGIRDGIPVSEAEHNMAELDRLFTDARRAMDGVALSGATAFGSAFVILLREGLEAILVIAALAAFLIKTERTDAMRYLHYGWIGALVMGFFTWWAATHLWTFSGEAREMTEAVAALVAAGVLLYVGMWMHSKTNAVKWQQFIQQSMDKALNGATLWSLAGLAFITVYREVFETILFYQTLWLQSSSSGTRMVVIGFVAAAGVLALLGWLILRYSPRLPLRQFFKATGALVFVLALVFTGKGIAALQEAGKLEATLINIPKIELLGIYPNAEGVGSQLLILVLLIGVLWWQRHQALSHVVATNAGRGKRAA